MKTETIRYQAGDVTCHGFLAYDDAVPGRRPGIVVCPEWWGLNDDTKRRAEMLAELGYVALAADLYGGGQRAENAQDASKLAGSLRSDRQLLRQRVSAALEQLKSDPHVDPARLAAIGYCFGGTAAIELARSGAKVKAIVAFHPGLDSPNPADGKNIKGRVLVCHGGDDPFTAKKDMEAFENEMRQNQVDWQMNVYGGAVHGFTNPNAGKRGIPGIAYNARADQRSWEAMQMVFHDVFGGPLTNGR